MDIFMVDVYEFCVEVFKKILSRTKMIDHSFERKFYGAYYTYLKMLCAGSVARNARTKF